ncbi:hypothetical protein GXW83_20415 [Streptacidiphilus sp. PB12-B1b]|uniref:hypothetical protein n=1 Tax=Streptacidiphilus sp. PB12-B1b TaxID=2705012 RepID=UPI0015F89F0B|nr:hypothetical protein [Streptacidiphilus sp. PB12-B1b]QMU77702.1 hypothetical protein GXW83_20415 [Streptacidiphilus sp. PB12-B1b]
MSHRHYFHLDHAGHSITVGVRSGHTPEVELLVDGKPVGYRHRHGTEATVLTGELASDPAQPFEVRVSRLRHGARAPVCTLELDGRELPMPERPLAPGPVGGR